MARPRLVLVSGTPATGKTTLAHEIGRMFPCPVVARDEIKEGMVHARGIGAPGWGDPIAGDAFALFYRIVSEYIRGDCSVVAEAAFFKDQPAAVVELLRYADAGIVHCQVDLATATERYAHRASVDPVRWMSHPDAELVIAMQAGTFPWARYEPMDIGVPVLTVDTTDGYDPPIAEILAFAHTC
jgi:predicted kinase